MKKLKLKSKISTISIILVLVISVLLVSLPMAAAQGSRLVVTCSGSDAQEAMAAVRALIESDFEEK